ncbi:MAG: DNA pilot protein [Microviridae sp.]|nr:MAG: DNA pilot protein [Microviridae sp.]
MPIPLPPLIDAGAELLSSGINAVIQSGENAKNRRFANWQYDKQRQDALADYNMQNEYNSPAAQMARLKAAGLNPNLVYGNGATTQSATVRSSSAPSPSTSAPKISLGNPGMSIMQAQALQAQTNNLKVQNDVLLEEKKLKAAQTLNVLSQTDMRSFDMGLKGELRNTTIAMAQKNLENLYSKIRLQDNTADLATDRGITERELRDSRRGLLNQQIDESMSRVILNRIQGAKSEKETAYIQEKIANAIRDGKIKDFEIRMNKAGVTKNDPAWLRMFNELLQTIID